MVNHKLWVGLRSYGWVSKMLVAFAIALALYMISEAAEYMDSHEQVGFVGMAFGSESVAWAMPKLWKSCVRV